MKRFRLLPIMVGKGHQKGLIAGRMFKTFGHGMDLLIVWLKRDCNTGDDFDFKDVDKVEAHIHFTDRSSLKLTIDVLQRLYDGWEEEKANENMG